MGFAVALLALYLLLILAETVAAARFAPGYYLRGLTVFRRIERDVMPEPGAITAEKLEVALDRDERPGVRFRHLTKDVLAFRPVMAGPGWAELPVTRGLIRIDPQSRTVEVRGLLAWYVPAGVLWIVTQLLLGWRPRPGLTVFLALAAAFAAYTIRVERTRLRKVHAEIARRVGTDRGRPPVR